MYKYQMYRKKNSQLMRPYREGEDMSGVSVTNGVVPRVGGMIAKTGEDIWYIPPQFFEDNYEIVE
jgi:hypothetical protein